jgi:hypothetical protein
MWIVMLIIYILPWEKVHVNIHVYNSVTRVYIVCMTHHYLLSEFIDSNWVELRKLAGSVLSKGSYGFDDDAIDELLSDLCLDLKRLRLLEIYDEAACKRYGIAFSTVIFRQFKNILSDRVTYRSAAKRSPDPSKSNPEPRICSDPYTEQLTVSEFLERLPQPLRELVSYKMAGYTGPEYCERYHVAEATPVKRMLRVRAAWTEYSSAA